MEWFLYNNGFRHEIINARTRGTRIREYLQPKLVTRIPTVKSSARMSVIYPFFVDVFSRGVI